MRAQLRAAAMRQHGAFHARQALTCYTPAEVRTRLRTGRWVRVHGNVYRHRDSAPGPRLCWSAAVLDIGTEYAACLHTAAELHGFGVLDDPVTHVAVDPQQPCRRRPGLWPHQLVLAGRDVERLCSGVVATTADRTAVDLARSLPRIDVLPVLDAALAAGACTVESLTTEVARHVGLPGVRQARDLIPLSTTGPESPQESRLRLRCHDAGLPRPTVQAPVLDAAGRPIRWVDLGWEPQRVGLEYDSAAFHGEPQRREDRRRHNAVQHDGWLLFYAVDLDVYRDHDDLLGKIGAALRARRALPPAPHQTR